MNENQMQNKLLILESQLEEKDKKISDLTYIIQKNIENIKSECLFCNNWVHSLDFPSCMNDCVLEKDVKRIPTLDNQQGLNLKGFDSSKFDSSGEYFQLKFLHTCLEEMGDLWKIGDEYPMDKEQREKIGLKEDGKLIISAIYENEYGVFMSMLRK